MGTTQAGSRSYRHGSSAVLQAFAVRSSGFRPRAGEQSGSAGEHEIHDRKVRPLSMDNRTKTAVLLDSHPLWLDAVEQVLTRIDISVLGKSPDTDSAMRLLDEHQPDLLVAEIEGSASGSVVQWFDEVRRRHPETKLIVLSAQADPERIDASFAAGAVAYVIKTAHPEDVCAAVRQAFEHSIFLPGSNGGGLRAVEPSPTPADEDDASVLTRREFEILQLVAEGHSNAQVGRMLWVTEQTVKFHLSNIYRKLDVSNRTEASRWAQTRNLLPPRTGEAASVN
jgi:DNA-binding NarL/FixJ family response regulator